MEFLIALLALGLIIAAGCSTTAIEGDSAETGSTFTPPPPPVIDMPLVTAEHPPPPIAGGTMAIANGVAVVGDPARLRVMIVDLDTEEVRETPVEGQPGRIVIDGDRAFVLLRNRGQLLTLDLSTATVTDSTAICSAPRGLAQHPDGSLRVACMGGAVLRVSPTGEVERLAQLDADLRDIVIVDSTIYVSWFRSAVVGELGDDGRIRRKFQPHELQRLARTHVPAVAWRMVPTPNGKIVVVHQTGVADLGDSDPPVVYYEGNGAFNCGRISGTGVTTIDPKTGAVDTQQISRVLLPVDVALKPGQRFGSFGLAVTAAGNRPSAGTGVVIDDWQRDADPQTNCQHGLRVEDGMAQGVESPLNGQATAVGYDATRERFVMFFREPAKLLLVDDRTSELHPIPLGGASIADTGHTLFHRDAGRGVACASCHPEAGDDGIAWKFPGIDGVRRTQMLRGGIKGTEPFHWEGDLDDFEVLADEVFSRRMGGPRLTGEYYGVFIDYIDRVPDFIMDPPRRPEAAERGKAVFERADVQCATCHLDGTGTDNRSYDVGTGGVFQTPALRGLSQRMPLMHTGCATTITERFSPACGGGDAHGKTSHLSGAEIADLIHYLSTL